MASEGEHVLVLSGGLFLPHRMIDVAKHQGINAAGGPNQLNAEDDLEAVHGFLRAKARKSEATIRQYKREVSRFIAWLAIERGVSISSVSADVIHDYERFLSFPTPESRWVGPKGKGTSRELSGGWKPPFAGPLSPSSISSSLTILRSMFSFLSETGYLRGNPFVAFGSVVQVAQDEQGRIHRVDGNTPVLRVLDEDDKQALMQAVELMPRGSKRELFWYHRVRWVLHLLLFVGLRRSEAAAAMMTDITKRKEGYFLSVVGKGRKMRMVPLPQRMIEELQVYRTSLGQLPMPLLGEETPLVVPKRRAGGNMSSMEIYRAVKMGLEQLIKILGERGELERAARVKKVSAHWLRHTYATDLIDSGADLRVAQDNLGHGDLNTTRRYVGENRRLQMEAVRKAFDEDVQN